MIIYIIVIKINVVKRESDNDYHMIIGDQSASQFFNIEISGLPPSSSPASSQLKAARKAVDQYFGKPVCNSGYHVFSPGIKIQVTGSTFFDIDHPAGAVGPNGFKPKTAWEIHPVTSITFLN